MPVDIYQALRANQNHLDDEYYQSPLSAEYTMVGPGIVVPSTTRLNGLGKKKPMTLDEEDEQQSQVYLSAPKSLTAAKGKGFSLAGSGGSRGHRGRGFYLAGEGRDRFDQTGGARRVHAVASKLLNKAYPAVFRGLGSALHHNSMYKLMRGKGMHGTGKVGDWFRKAGQNIKGAFVKAGHWAKQKLWQPLLDRAKKMFGDFIRDKLKQYIPDTEAGIQDKANELLDKAFNWIASKLPPGWNAAAGAAFEILRPPLRQLAASAIKKGFDSLHKVSEKTGINMNFDEPKAALQSTTAAEDKGPADTSTTSTTEDPPAPPDAGSSGKGYGGHLYGGRRISSAQLSALVRNHAMNKIHSNPKYMDAFANF